MLFQKLQTLKVKHGARALPRLLLCGLLAAIALPAAADELSQTKAGITQAQQEIAELERLIKQIQQEKSQAQKNLQTTEKEIGDLEKSIRSLEGEQKKNQQEIEQFEQEKSQLESSRQQQQKLIAIQSRAAYQAGQGEPMRLVFNQQKPAAISHNLTYYQYLQQARHEQVSQFQRTVQQLSELQLAISQHQQELEQQKSELASQQAKLATLREQRRQQVQALNKKQQGSQQKLASRKRDQQRLGELLDVIEKKLARQAEEERLRKLHAEMERERQRQLALQQTQRQIQQTAPGTQRPRIVERFTSKLNHPGGNFAKVRGQLPWPVSGPLLARFDSPRGDTRSRWDGVLIKASEGSQVRAIHPGKVVYADWLRGSGLLVIIDHGDSYLSLYGHNQSLMATVGQRVGAGQPIATVGNTGGQQESALYFAIRKQGQAIDPGQWCRTQG